MQRFRYLIVLAACLISLFTGNVASSQESTQVKWRDYKAGRKEAINRKSPIFLIFWTNNSVPDLRTLMELEDSKVASVLNERFVPIKLNESEEPKLMATLAIDRFPTTVIADADGVILHKRVGFVDAEEMLKLLQMGQISTSQEPQSKESPSEPRSEADRKLEQAFGVDCAELKRPYRLWLPGKGIALSAGQFDIEERDGRVRLTPFSVALFHNGKAADAYSEITVIKCDVAFITLDRPLSQLSELPNRKVIAVEMQGKQPGVSLSHNRGTAAKSDDLDILITNSSVFYEERRNLLWSDGVLRLADHKTNPPTIVRGQGCELTLTRQSNPNRNNGTCGIERLLVRSDAEIVCWVDPHSGRFFDSQDKKKSSESAGKAARANQEITRDKAQLFIRTGGMFVYDLTRQTVSLESPPEHKDKKKPLAPDHVHVQRVQKAKGKETFDQLMCDRLDVQFQRRADQVKEIKIVKATARAGQDVVLSLDTERIAIYGNYLFYQNGSPEKESQTILKGNPLSIAKDRLSMITKELRISGVKPLGKRAVIVTKDIPQEAPPSIRWRNDYHTARKEAKDRKLPIFLVLFAENSVPDLLTLKAVEDLKVASVLNEQFIPMKINGMRGEEPKLTAVLGIDRFPTIVIAAPDGLVLHKRHGVIYADDLLALLQRSLRESQQHMRKTEFLPDEAQGKSQGETMK